MTYFYEDKETIINCLLYALKQTVAGVGLDYIRYEQLTNGDEIAVLMYDNGYRKSVNITCDSGVALMRDILRNIE